MHPYLKQALLDTAVRLDRLSEESEQLSAMLNHQALTAEYTLKQLKEEIKQFEARQVEVQIHIKGLKKELKNNIE